MRWGIIISDLPNFVPFQVVYATFTEAKYADFIRKLKVHEDPRRTFENYFALSLLIDRDKDETIFTECAYIQFMIIIPRPIRPICHLP